MLLLLVCVYLQQKRKSSCFSVSYCAFCCVGAKKSSGSVCVALVLCVTPAENSIKWFGFVLQPLQRLLLRLLLFEDEKPAEVVFVCPFCCVCISSSKGPSCFDPCFSPFYCAFGPVDV